MNPIASSIPQYSTDPVVVGILNVTPDSFSDGGSFFSEERARDHAQQLIQAGAHIIEVGGESTAPGSSPIGAEAEWQRIGAVVKALAPLCTLSVDTFRAETAQRAIANGAHIINDVSALRFDPRMIDVLADSKARVIIMHSKQPGTNPHVDDSRKDYGDIVQEICAFLLERVALLKSNGISADRIVLDPGLGRFLSHDPRYSWELLDRLGELTRLLQPYPVMIGASRKGFLGGALAERDPISQLTSILAVIRGARWVRVHQVGMFWDFWHRWCRNRLISGEELQQTLATPPKR